MNKNAMVKRKLKTYAVTPGMRNTLHAMAEIEGRLLKKPFDVVAYAMELFDRGVIYDGGAIEGGRRFRIHGERLEGITLGGVFRILSAIRSAKPPGEKLYE